MNTLVPGDNGEFRIITELEDPKNPRIEPERALARRGRFTLAGRAGRAA
ncbi:MAG: hypothetical protein MZV65_41860 [Chromatiales bacterium]|nr:hypothetical protein [Chromatiales bacterium]